MPGNISGSADHFNAKTVKGEIVIVVEGKNYILIRCRYYLKKMQHLRIKKTLDQAVSFNYLIPGSNIQSFLLISGTQHSSAAYPTGTIKMVFHLPAGSVSYIKNSWVMVYALVHPTRMMNSSQ